MLTSLKIPTYDFFWGRGCPASTFGMIGKFSASPFWRKTYANSIQFQYISESSRYPRSTTTTTTTSPSYSRKGFRSQVKPYYTYYQSSLESHNGTHHITYSLYISTPHHRQSRINSALCCSREGIQRFIQDSTFEFPPIHHQLVVSSPSTRWIRLSYPFEQ